MTAEPSLALLARWLRAQPGVPEDLHEPTALVRLPGGQSNPTYRLDTVGRSYVLRRQPFGALLPSAHALDREYRLLAALRPRDFPVPAPVCLCRDSAVIGAMFYIMERVQGRTFWNGSLPDATAGERSELYRAMIATLGRLHRIDPAAIGLADFGRPGDFFARQVDRWTRQYRAAQTETIGEMEHLIAWLPTRIPAPGGVAIVHGDYRIDNLIFAGNASTVAAVIDWELATIGDPLADLAYLMMNWILPADGRAGLGGIDLARAGIPDRAEALDIYAVAGGSEPPTDLSWHFAFGLFRLAAIVQGIKQRQRAGNASSANADASIAMLVPLARAAWEQARLAGAN